MSAPAQASRTLARRAAGAILRRYPALLLAALLLSAVGGYFSSRLRLDSNLAALLPDGYDSVRTLRRADEEVGGFQTLRILIEGPDFAALERYAERLAGALTESPMVLVVDYQKDVEFFEEHALLYAEYQEVTDVRDRLEERIKEEKLASNPLWIDLEEEEGEEGGSGEKTDLEFEDLKEKYEATDEKRYYINPEKTILVLNVYPDGAAGDVAFARRFYREARRVVAAEPPASIDPRIEVEYGGNFKNKIDEYEVIIGDVQTGAAISLSAVFLLIAVFFRSVRAALTIALSLSVGIAWTFGLAYGLVGSLNIMTVFLFIVLFGLGIDFGIHLYSRYAEERRGGRGARTALEIALSSTGSALVATAVTTSLAFFSLLFADFRGFSEFGFIAGTGVLMALAAVLLTLPGFILVGERIRPASWRSFRQPWGGGPAEGGRFPAPGLVLALGAGLAVLGLISLGRVELQYDFTQLRANLPASVEVKEKLGRIFDDSNSPAIVIAEDRAGLAEVEEAIRRLKEADDTPTIDKFRSIYTALPEDQDRKLDVIVEIRELLADDALNAVSDQELEQLDRLRDMADVQPVEPSDLPEHIRRIFRGDGGEAVEFGFIFPSVPLRDGKNAIRFAEDVRRIETESGNVYHASNTSVVLADMLLMMVREGKIAVLFTFLTVFIVATASLRGVGRAILALIPLLAGLAWLFLAMRVFAWKLNFYNIVVIPAIVGIGIDSGIHLFHRYREEGQEGAMRALRTTGTAVSIASVTTMLGFLGLALARHPGLASIGRLAVLGIGLTLLAALTLLPAALQLRRGRVFRR